jgi:hypothetical protein
LKDSEIGQTAKLYNRLHKIAKKWFWVETNVTPIVEPMPNGLGFIWYVKDTQSNSLNYKWLSRKAQSFGENIVKRLSKRSNVAIRKAWELIVDEPVVEDN